MAMKVLNFARNDAKVSPDLESYGLEVEAERYHPDNWAADGKALKKFWKLDKDGSLRNNGVEFISVPTPAPDVPEAISVLYKVTGKKWEPSVRTGVHIHANCLGRTTDELRKIAAYYAFAEPVLFDMAGENREENIYCVPWYRAPEEAEAILAAIKYAETEAPNVGAIRAYWSESCKYSAMYFGPLATYGTVEFRHAETFADQNSFLDWWGMCRSISLSYTLPDPVRLYANGNTALVLRTLFGGRHPDEFYVDMAARAEELGCHEIALRFQPCTYKLGEWGKPGEFALNRRPQAEAVAAPRRTIEDVLRDQERDMMRAALARPVRRRAIAEPVEEEPVPMFVDDEEEF